jgi:hypothetical protein
MYCARPGSTCVEGVLRDDFRNLLPPIGSGDRTEEGRFVNSNQCYVNDAMTKVGMEDEGCRICGAAQPWSRYNPNITDAAVSFRLTLAPSARL